MASDDSNKSTITTGAVEALLHYWLQKLEYDLNGETVAKPEYSLSYSSEEPLMDLLSDDAVDRCGSPSTALQAGYRLGITLTVAVTRDPLGDPLPAVKAAIEEAEDFLRTATLKPSKVEVPA